MHTPVETLVNVAESWSVLSEIVRPTDKPGEAFAKLPEEVKEKLRNLKSDDAAKIRWDLVELGVLHGNHMLEKRKRLIKLTN